MKRKRLVSLLLAVVVAAALAIPALAATRTVRVGDDYFVSRSTHTVTVKRGTIVRWRWVGDNLHNVRVRRGPVKFRSRLKRSGTYSRRMRRVGTYRIICDLHAPDMRMTLRVRR
jgi:plastocyanin